MGWRPMTSLPDYIISHEGNYPADDGQDQVDAALSGLAVTAVAVLRQEMSTAKSSKDRIAAANSILDRLGYGRTTRTQADTADRDIRNALEVAKRAQEEADAANARKAIEQPRNAEEDGD